MDNYYFHTRKVVPQGLGCLESWSVEEGKDKSFDVCLNLYLPCSPGYTKADYEGYLQSLGVKEFEVVKFESRVIQLKISQSSMKFFLTKRKWTERSEWLSLGVIVPIVFIIFTLVRK